MSAQSIYTRLPSSSHFRILELHQGSPSDPLRGTLLQLANLDAAFHYEALSYRWSDVDPDNPVAIEINGMTLPVGPELNGALRQFRLQGAYRYLWIDQICINQSDEKEKIGQIQNMGRIYSGAQKVLIWLGDARDQSDEAMEFFPKLVEQIQRDDERLQAQEPTHSESNTLLWKSFLASSLAKLFSRAWFERVWTLQEAALNQNAEFWCGQKHFPYQVFEDFGRGCSEDENGYWGNILSLIGGSFDGADSQNPRRPINGHVYVVSSLRAGGRSSSRILNSLRSLDCSEHRDRIYSVLRFLNTNLVQKIVAEGMKSAAELYQFVAMNELEGGDLQYLGASGLSQHRTSYFAGSDDSSRPLLSLPSWVPDWTYVVRVHSYWVLNGDCLEKRGRPLYTAAGSLSTENSLSFSENLQHLCVDVAIFGEVSQCSPPFPTISVPEDPGDHRSQVNIIRDNLYNICSFIESCMELAAECKRYAGSANIERACRHSLVGSMVPDGPGTTDTGVLVRASDKVVDLLFEDFQKLVSGTEDMVWLSQRGTYAKTATDDEQERLSRATASTKCILPILNKHNLVRAIAEACKGRRFFITGKDQFMGVAPDITQPGDKVCIIPGCCAPFVIRPIGDVYQLVGECYVAGIMDGELIEETNPSMTTIVII